MGKYNFCDNCDGIEVHKEIKPVGLYLRGYKYFDNGWDWDLCAFLFGWLQGANNMGFYCFKVYFDNLGGWVDVEV